MIFQHISIIIIFFFHATEGGPRLYMHAEKIAPFTFTHIEINNSLQPSGCKWSLFQHFVLLP